MTDPTRLARSALLALVLAGVAAAPLVAFAPDAHACSLEKPPVPESPPAPALAPGIYDLGPLRTQIARDGGILFDALAPGLSDADLLAGITLDVETAEGTKVPGALRIFPGAAASSTAQTLRRLQFVPSDGTFAANATLRVKAAFTRAVPEASVKVPTVPFGGTDTWSFQIGTALLAEAAVPGVTLQPGGTLEMDDTSSPSFTCTLAQPEVANDSCGGSETITTRKFFARRKNLVIAEQRVVFKEAPGADAYVTTKTRVVADGGRVIAPETTLLPEQSGVLVPEGVTGQICVEVEVSSLSLPGFPKTARACMTVPDVPQPDQAANDAWVRTQSKACSNVSPPTGLAPASGAAVDDGADGCHAAPGRAQGTFAWLTLGVVVSEVIRRRKRR